MKKELLILQVLLFTVISGNSQRLDSVLDVMIKDRRYDTLIYTLCKNEKWAKNFKTKTFENQGRMHSYYFGINDDSTFVFQAFYEPGIDIAIGSCHKVNDSVVNITWNKKATSNIFTSKKEYRKYSKFLPSHPIKIDNWNFMFYRNMLLPARRKQD